MKFLTKNFSIKLVCLLAAAILWVYVVSTQSSIAKFPGAVKIKAINNQPGLVAVYDVKRVEIKVMTQSSNWKKLSADSFSAYIDLSGYDSGTHEVPVNVVSSVPDVQIVEKNPEKVLVTLEPLITKTVPVNKKIEGKAAPGMAVGSVVFLPELVEIKGAKTLVENTREVLAKINLNGEETDFTRKIPLILPDDNDDIEIVPSETEANISIVKGSDIKSVGVKVNTTGNPKEGYFVSNIKLEPSVLDATGPIEVLNELKYLETLPVDVSNASSSISTEAMVKLPNGVILQGQSFSKVKVEIAISPLEVYRDISTGNFQALGGSNFDISFFSPPAVTIKCFGPITILNGLKPSDVVINLNFSNKTKDQNNEINFDLSGDNILVPKGVSVMDITPKKIAVKVK
jgi:YbbR domain-containing protein